MKHLSLAIVLALAPTLMAAPLGAQGAPHAPATPSLAPFAWMDGAWRGEATIDMPGGRIKLTQTERSGTMLGGAVRVIEGRGYGPKGDLQFNAMGVIYARPDGSFAMHSWAQGREGIFPIKLVEGGFDWEMPAGPMTIRYEARLVGGKWTERGFRIVPGKAPTEFYRMELSRVGVAKGWPAAGAIPAR